MSNNIRSDYDCSAFQIVTFHGDSFTKGLYASSEETTYRSLLTGALRLGGGASQVRRIATTGAQMAGALTQPQAADDVAQRDADLVILAYGINDVTGGAGDFVPESTFRIACQDVMDAYAGRVVICAGVAWCGWADGTDNYLRAAAYSSIIEDEATQRGYRYTDLWNITKDRDELLSSPSIESSFDPAFQGDNFHYGDVGHNVIFQSHWATLTATLSKISRSASGERSAAGSRSAAGPRTAA